MPTELRRRQIAADIGTVLDAVFDAPGMTRAPAKQGPVALQSVDLSPGVILVAQRIARTLIEPVAAEADAKSMLVRKCLSKLNRVLRSLTSQSLFGCAIAETRSWQAEGCQVGHASSALDQEIDSAMRLPVLVLLLVALIMFGDVLADLKHGGLVIEKAI